MRTFEIIDRSSRKARPCAYLRYDESQDEFGIRLSEDADENGVPLMLCPFLQNGERDLGPEWSRRWVRERIVPAGRQNIGQVLKAHDLQEYDEFALLLSSMGRCAQDDFILREIDSDASESSESSRPATVVQTAGARLAQSRKEAGITQADLSRRTGIQQAVISRIERGEGNPTLETLGALAAGLGKELHIDLQ